MASFGVRTWPWYVSILELGRRKRSAALEGLAKDERVVVRKMAQQRFGVVEIEHRHRHRHSHSET